MVNDILRKNEIIQEEPRASIWESEQIPPEADDI